MNDQAPTLSYRLDYVKNSPYPEDSAGHVLPLVEVWGIDTSQLRGFVDTSQWVSSSCRAGVPDPFEPPTQASMAPTDPCLYTNQFLDADRYLTQADPVIAISFSDQTIYNIPLCPATSSQPKLFFQTDRGYTYTDEGGVYLQPVIQEVLAPPGVYIRAYIGLATPDEWSKGKLPSGAINCAWTALGDQQGGWWPGAVGSSSESSFQDLHLMFEEMVSWWPKDNTDWPALGCGSVGAVIALEYALESSFFTHTPQATFCALSAPVPLTFHGYLVRKPNCGYDGYGNPYRAFRVRDSVSGFALWRCSLCTRYQAAAVSGAGMFGCTLSNGKPLTDLFTQDMLQSTFPLLYDPQALSGFAFGMPTRVQAFDNGTQSLLVLAEMLPLPNDGLGSLSGWGTCGSLSSSKNSKMWDCPTAFMNGMDFDTTLTLYNEQNIWDKAVNNPSVPLTMTCQGQQYTSSSEEQCNPNTDARRQRLAQFVEEQYRQTNGVWLPQVEQGWGVAFPANVAHSAVSKFTLFYASADRPAQQVVSAWNLGSGPCSSQSTTLEDRICAESTLAEGSRFEPMHPWVGGDFNPFAMLDECPFSTPAQCLLLASPNQPAPSTTTVSMCSCQCSPAWACGGSKFNYSADFMAAEFPTLPACQTQTYTQTRVMYPTDSSNICSQQPKVQDDSAVCTTQQGVLGGVYKGQKVTATQMHSASGVANSAWGAAQTLLPYVQQGENLFDNLQSTSSIWSGAQGSHFLSMPRSHLHPAHIVFGLDATLSSMPLMIQGISLLPSSFGSPSPPLASWASSLHLQWLDELKGTVWNLYPQLLPSSAAGADWSCPIRKLVFWGSVPSASSFGPITPNPVVSALLFNLSGAHPFFLPSGPYPNLAEYFTPNGGCFYRKDPSTWPRLQVGDMESPCSLRGILHLLESGEEAGISIQEPFADRCNDIIDTPDVGGTLRSGEQLPPSQDLLPQCGLLPRLTPALISTKGDTAPILPSTVLNTSLEGGDCHMGRLALVPIGKLQGLQCATTGKSASSVTVFCPFSNQSMTFSRARPLALSDLVAQNAVVYRSDPSPGYPVFKGPAKVKLADNEISFGQLYAASLKETLSSDLLRYAAPGAEPWTGSNFFQRYLNGSLVKEPPVSTASADQQGLLLLSAAQSRDDGLWNGSDWLWSFNNHSQPRGNMSRTAWSRSRVQACNASLEAYILTSPPQQQEDSVRRISLCAPAPTGDLGTLCTSMMQFSVDVTQVNCQAMGHGDCISNLGMFYLPYMWSTTNQDYSYNTVSNYYSTLVGTYFSNESFQRLCSAETDASVLQALAKLSAAQNSICPATGLELIKAMLSDLRTAGHDLLYLYYNSVMMIANLVAAVFASVQGQSQEYLQAAAQYLIQVLQEINEILNMVLDILTELILFVSNSGKAVKDVILALCTAYNWWLWNVTGYWWCEIVRPLVIGLLTGIRDVAFMSSAAVSTMQTLLNVIGDGDADSCRRVYQTTAQLKCPAVLTSDYNSTQFQPQALATLCWAQGQQGGGLYTGATDALLSCTSSDTCALDPLLFDDPTKAGLVYCGSCPSVQGAGFRFGCDVYLQRCVCGTLPQAKSDCLTNADCQQQQAMCSVGSQVTNVRSSYISVSCSTCGSMSMDPICIMDGQAAGVCGCANIVSNLMTCMPSQLGTRSMLGFSSQLCAVVTDPSLQQMLANTAQSPQAIAIDFSSVAIAQCSLGGYQNLCLNLHIPLVSSGGVAESPYVVLLELLSLLQPSSRRRLLAMSPQILFPDWMQQHQHDPLPKACHAVTTRHAMKLCLYRAHLGAYTIEHYNLSGVIRGDPFDLFEGMDGWLSLAPSLWADPDLQAFVLLSQMSPSWGRTLIQTGGSMKVLWDRLLRSGNATAAFQAKRNLLGASNNNNQSVTIEANRGDWSLNCTSAEVPLGKITGAFWDTVHLYQRGPQGNNQSSCDVSQGLGECLGYKLPPEQSASPAPLASQILLYVPTLGIGGNRILDSILSPMSYGEAQEGDYITGQRILQDMGSCNFTRLTFGPQKQRNFLAMLCFLIVLFHVISYFCLPFSFCTWMLWYLLFPVVLFWSLYNISPLCWPMIPPHFVQDLNTEINGLLPTDIQVPRYLVKPQCTVDGRLSDGTYDPACFGSCADPPFLFTSWQDTLIWWVCEASTSSCMDVGRYLSQWDLFQDLSSSADYYGSVIRFSYRDPELVQAHRLCAILSSYNLVFLLLICGLCCYVLPSVLLTVIDVFAGCMLLVLDTYNVPEDEA